MATSSVIGALRVVLGLDTGSYEKGLKDAEKKAASASGGISGVIGGLVVAAGAALTGFGAAILGSIEKMDKLGKASEKAGVPIEQFSVLAGAAAKSGVDLDSFTGGMVKLAKAMSDAGGAKLAGPTAQAFKAIGVSATEAGGKLRSSSDVVEQLADKFASFKDSPAKTALAIAIFGRAGAEMIPFLNKGGDAIRRQREEMEALGLVMTEATKGKVREFEESWSKLSNVFGSLITNIAVGMTPALADVAKSLAGIAKDAKQTTSIGEFLGSAFKYVSYQLVLFSLEAKQAWEDLKGLAEVAQLAAEPISNLWGVVVALAGDISSLFSEAYKWFSETLSGMYDSTKNFLQPIIDFFNKLLTPLNSLKTAADASIFKTISDGLTSMGNAARVVLAPITSVVNVITTAVASKFKNTGEAVDTFSKSIEGGGKAVEKFNQVTANSETGFKNAKESLSGWFDDTSKAEAFGAVLAELDKKAESLGIQIKQALQIDAPKIGTNNFAKALEDLKFKAREAGGEFNKLPAGFAALAHSIDPLYKLPATFDQLTGKMKQLALAQADYNAKAAVTAAKPQWEQDKIALDQLQVSLDLAKVKGVDAAAAIAAASDKMASNWKNAASSIVNDLAGGFAALASVNKEWSAAAKIAAYAQAVWNTYLAATKALATYPPPYSYLAAGAAVVAGLGYVAKIQAQQFATGGSFKVGGTGGVDSQLVQFMATPGEMVDVKTPGQAAGGGSGGGAQTITLRGRRMTDMMTLDDMRLLVEGLNAANRDGYKLKFAQ